MRPSFYFQEGMKTNYKSRFHWSQVCSLMSVQCVCEWSMFLRLRSDYMVFVSEEMVTVRLELGFLTCFPRTPLCRTKSSTCRTHMKKSPIHLPGLTQCSRLSRSDFPLLPLFPDPPGGLWAYPGLIGCIILGLSRGLLLVLCENLLMKATRRPPQLTPFHCWGALALL